jgi:hypothetical protein
MPWLQVPGLVWTSAENFAPLGFDMHYKYFHITKYITHSSLYYIYFFLKKYSIQKIAMQSIMSWQLVLRIWKSEDYIWIPNHNHII